MVEGGTTSDINNYDSPLSMVMDIPILGMLSDYHNIHIECGIGMVTE